MPRARRFDWTEMRRYWETHSARWAELDFSQDPEGLTNVCHPGAPLWLNRYYARFQRLVFEELLARVPAPDRDSRALDVGTGAARWARLLADAGYQTTGIDLQPELIERNRARHPDIAFALSAAQEFRSDPFDLISSVTVIQHVPFEEQQPLIAHLRALCRPRAHAIVLENVRDQDPHVFANPIDEWIRRFERNGFEVRAIRRYDYSPFLRMLGRTRRVVRKAVGRRDVEEPGITPEGLVHGVARGDALSALSNAAKRAAVALDSAVEPLLVRANVPVSSVHCGFVFEAR